MTLATFKFEDSEKDTNYFLGQLAEQLDSQFYEDGTNFEGSSHYSAFVTEALLISKLAIECINPESPLLKTIEKVILSNKNRSKSNPKLGFNIFWPFLVLKTLRIELKIAFS